MSVVFRAQGCTVLGDRDIRYAVVGVGAIGGVLGAYLARAGKDVTLVEVAADHVDAMRTRGLTIDVPAGPFTVPVSVRYPNELVEPLDTVLLAVKAGNTREALAPITPLLGPESTVVSFQNGFATATIADIVGRQRTIGVCIYNFFADYIEPGHISMGGNGAFYVGELDGRMTPRLKALAADLQHWDDVKATANVLGYLWSKLGFINMIIATALTNESMVDLFDTHQDLMVELACEVYEAADREGVTLETFHDVEPHVYYPRERRNTQALQTAFDALVATLRTNKKQRSGMWRDLAVHRRPTEVRFLTGAAVEIGWRHGLEMPLSAALNTMVDEIERGRRSLGTNNIAELEAIRARTRKKS